ncbi:MAG: hypothetical protein QG656_84, partial [Candidatus Hydrogenedentes bacterium]|nr:hypothetical protein [Candidatus Hydrogenedentota bacterium]
LAVECNVTMLYNDPRNPFVHRYHPDHDNLEEDYTPRPDPQSDPAPESYSFVRRIRLTFTATDPDLPEGSSVPGWGDTEAGGTFDELFYGYKDQAPDPTTGGFNKQPIHTQGTFHLRRISDVAALDTAS